MKRELMGLIVKRDDGSEIINYDNPSFPSYVFDGWIRPKVTWERVPHFHEDIEICTVKSGRMAYCVNGKTVMLHDGDTIVVNANQIHYSMSVTEEMCKYTICIIHPDILCSSIIVDMQAIRPILENPEISYIVFDKLEASSDTVYQLVTALPPIRHDAFAVTKQFFLIWEQIRLASMNRFNALQEPTADAHMQAFKNMLHYVCSHFQENITLKDIAKEANISKSLCNTLFKQYVNESPITYLMHIRARKVAEYLTSTSYSLSEIAGLTGFAGASYMSETFKKFFGKSPREYRKSPTGFTDDQLITMGLSESQEK